MTLLWAIIILAVILPPIELLYIRLARHLGIGARPYGDVSQHFTPIGGGIIIYIGALLPAACGLLDFHSALLLGGAALLGVLSFADDLVKLPPGFRLIVQIMVIATVLWQLPANGLYDAYILGGIACVGYINSSNFMDGINGMLCLYGLVVLASLLAVLMWFMPPTDPYFFSRDTFIDLCIGLSIALAVFAFFNCRRHALVFAGDVGSIGLGYFSGIMLVMIVLVTGYYSVALFVIIYIIDTFFTFLERLFNGEDVMKPHCKHLYQRLVSHGYAPLKVSAAYAALQAAINILWFAIPEPFLNLYAILVTLAVMTTYIVIKTTLKHPSKA